MYRNDTLTALRSRFSRFGGDRSGIAAMEFALIAPMMLVLLFVSFEMTDLLGAVKRSENATASIADVVARDVVVTDSEIADVLSALQWLVFPGPADAVSVRVTSVLVDGDGQAAVVWSDALRMSPLEEGAPLALPSGLLSANTGLIMVETATDYHPPLGLFAAAPFTFNKVEYRRARISDPVMRAAS